MAQTTLNNGSTFGVIRNAINTMLTELYTSVAAKADATATTTAIAAKANSTDLATETTNRTNADALLVPLTQKGAANGVASLGADSKVPVPQMTGKLATTDLTDGAALNTAVSNNTAAAAAVATNLSAESTARANADALLVPLTQKGAANGVATLGSDSKVPNTQMTGKLATTDLTDGAALNTAVSNNAAAAAAAQTTANSAAAAVTALGTKGSANGIASLDSTGKVPAAQLPASSSLPTAAQINALGLPCAWNPLTNVATLYDSSTISLATNTAPTGDNAFYATVSGTLLVPLTLATGGQITTVNANDIVYYAGTGWGILYSSANGTSGAKVLKGDGTGGITNAVAGTGGDYCPPITYQSGVPIGIAPPGTIGPNGFLTIPNSYIFTTGGGTSAGTTFYYSTGAWLYFYSGAVTPSSPSGFYWTQMGLTGVMYGTLTTAGSGYTNGVYTSVPLTNITGTGSGALATVTVAGGVVTSVVVTVQGTGYAVGNTLSVAASSVGGTGSGLVYTVATLNAYSSSGVATFTLTNGGSGYANGTYYNVPLSATSGTGVGCQATITVLAGVVTIVTPQIQGSSFAVGNTLSIPALGGSGSGCVLTVLTLGGPMTGTVYSNTYLPGNNTGAWTSGNLSLYPPVTPTPVVHATGGGQYGVPTYGNSQICIWATKITGGYMGNNGSIRMKYFWQSMMTSVSKVLVGNFATGAQPGVSGVGGTLGAQSILTTASRIAGMAEMWNRGVPNVQISPSSDYASAGASALVISNIQTSNDFWLRICLYANVIPGGSINAYQALFANNSGSGYTPGTYTNVPMTGGSGSGARTTVTIGTSGTVTSLVFTNFGSGYHANDNLSFAASSVGGTGSGYSVNLQNHMVTNAGSGYTDGVYANVPLTGGTGSGATANITISGGVIVGFVVALNGSGYAAADVLSASTAKIGSGGSGFAVTVGANLCTPDWSVLEACTVQVNPAA